MSRFDTLNSNTDGPRVTDAPILHVDLDAFFASVEILDDPTLRGKPVAVGGAGDRGVIASASYEARRYGVYSAMPSVMAKRKCPNLIILPGRFDRYSEYSRRFQDIVKDLTPDFEPLGLDEVFADLSSLVRLDIRPISAAHQLRDRIQDELHVGSGIGLASNKLFAKLASKRAKPRISDGVLTEGPGVVWADNATCELWLNELPVRALWGVGPATSERLARLGVTSIRELRDIDESVLRPHFGRAMAHSLSEMAHGRDDRPVTANRVTKSIGSEETFSKSLMTVTEVMDHTRRHAAIVGRTLRSSNQVANTISIGLRFDDLSSVSRAQTLNFGIDDDAAICEIASALMESIPFSGAVRLLGVGASSLHQRDGNQVQLAFHLAGDDANDSESRTRMLQATRGALNDAVDDLRRRFGRSIIGVGSDLGDGGVDIAVQRGAHGYGLTADSDNQRP